MDRSRELGRADVARVLREQHEHLRRMFDEVMRATYHRGWRDCSEVWARFTRALQDHIRFEEGNLLPWLAEQGPDGDRIAREIREEHQRIRQDLDQVAFLIPLDAARGELVERVIDSARTVFEREREALYADFERGTQPDSDGRGR